MIGHQRDILNALGIDLWIPKGVPCQPHSPALWRDQATPEPVSEIILPHLHTSVPAVNAEPFKAKNTQIQQPIEAETVPAPAVVEAPREILTLAPFAIQAISLAHCTIVLDATELSESQHTLWTNIQRAVIAEFAELRWPFAWDNVQDARGASSYVQGFLDARSLDKKMIALGALPQGLHTDMIQLASLQDMLDQPILKKRLWQFMQNRSIHLE